MESRQVMAAVVLGFSSLVAQLLLTREFISVFSGNELVIGVLFANWLLLTGLGALLGNYFHLRKESVLAFLLLVFGFLPFLLLLALRRISTGYGVMVSLQHVWLFSFVILLPFCLLSGFIFTFLAGLLKRAGKVYSLESLGSVFGGVLFGFFLIFYASPFQTALLILVLNLIVVLWHSKRPVLWVSVLIIPVLAGLLVDFDLLSLSWQFPGEQILSHENSLYGQVVLTNSSGQLNLYFDRIPIQSSNSTIVSEESVHYALSQVANPQKVLVVSGGMGVVLEALKYPNSSITYLELDPSIIRLAFPGFADERVSLIAADARSFISGSEQRFDAILISLPDPLNGEINRYYTREFFTIAKKHLAPQGVLSLSLTGSADYMSEQTRQLASSVQKTLHSAFNNILVFPGERLFFVASDSNISYARAYSLSSRGIQANYVNQHYLDANLAEDRLAYVQSAVNESASVNTDFRPVSYYYALQSWMNQFPINLPLVLFILLCALIAYCLFLEPLQFSIFTTGLSSSALQLVLLLSFQSLYGYAYFEIVVLSTSFILGLAFGSFLTSRLVLHFSRRQILLTELVIIVLVLLLPLTLMFLRLPTLDLIIFPTFSFALAVCCGSQFVIASREDSAMRSASKLYSSDLIGAAFGAIAASVLLVPLIGLLYTCLVLALLKLSSYLLMRAS
ncbi:MAG: hypothetical protein V1837_03835 [Candidatus Woesearchaeota archaeon]